MDQITPKKSKTTILLSINAAAVFIAGVLIASAIWFNGGVDFRMVGERSDIVEDTIGEMALLESVSDSNTKTQSNTNTIGNDDYISTSSHEFDSSSVPSDELWNENNITIYATPDVDICVGGSLSDLGDMYWETSDTDVIAGFYT